MVMKSLILSLLLMTASALYAQNKISYLKMDRTACFGRCPVYTVELMSDGGVYYEGMKNTEFVGKREAHLTPQQMQKFFKQLAKYKLAMTQSTYKPISTDLPHMHLNFTLNGQLKAIRNAESGPKFLSDIGKKVDSLITTLSWKESRELIEEQEPVLQIGLGADKNASMVVKEEPMFPGGDQAMLHYISSNIVYPKAAADNKIQGNVICRFTVDANGKIKNVKVVKSVEKSLDDEALRVIQSMPTWKPAKENGKPVDAQLNIPVVFTLN